MTRLHVRAGGAHIAFDFDVVAEVAELGPTVAVPGAATWCLGLVQWRGRLLTLIDAGQVFGRGPATPRQQVVLAGLQVEAVLAVDELINVFGDDEPADVVVDRSTLARHPAFQAGAAAPCEEVASA